MSSLQQKDGSAPASNMASELSSTASPQELTPVPAMALTPTPSELRLAPTHCPNCKVLTRHLRISREWNNFFRLKLDQRDMLLHVAADYKRQKQRCLQLQMALDERNRECGEMREQLTNLLLEMSPLRENLQTAETAAQEEASQREKAEARECNLQFIIDQQAHKLQSLKKLKPGLVEVLERKLSHLRGEVKRFKRDREYRSCTEWELKEVVSVVQAKQVRILKKAHWGLRLASVYGNRLINQGQLLDGEAFQEWVRLKDMLEKVETELHQHYLACCQREPVRPVKTAWLNDFEGEDCQEDGAVGAEDSGAKQLERLIQDDSEGLISEVEAAEQQDEMKEHKEVEEIQEKFEDGSQLDCCCTCPESTSERDKLASLELLKSEPKNNVPCSSCCQGTQDLTEVLPTSILDTSIEDRARDSTTTTIGHSTVDKARPHTVNTRDARKDTKSIGKLTPILDSDGETDPILTGGHDTVDKAGPHVASQGTRKETETIVKPTLTLDTTIEDSERPRGHDTQDTGSRQETEPSILDTSTDDTGDETADSPRERVGEAAPFTPHTGIMLATQGEMTKSTSILDNSIEDTDEEPLAAAARRPEDVAAAPRSVTVEMRRKDTGELAESATLMKESEKDCCLSSTGQAAAPTVNPYRMDEELQAILQEMRPHKKLEGMDTSLSPRCCGTPADRLPGTDAGKKQDFLSLLLSDSEEEGREMKRQGPENEDDDVSFLPRILTAQTSEEFSVAAAGSQRRDNSSLLEDLDISTDTLDPEGDEEKEEETKRRVPLPHFPSSQSFSFDIEECVPPSNSLQNPAALMPAAAQGTSKGQPVPCQSQLQRQQQVIDHDANNTVTHRSEHKTTSSNTPNKLLLMKRRQQLFAAVDDTAEENESEVMTLQAAEANESEDTTPETEAGRTTEAGEAGRRPSRGREGRATDALGGLDGARTDLNARRRTRSGKISDMVMVRQERLREETTQDRRQGTTSRCWEGRLRKWSRSRSELEETEKEREEEKRPRESVVGRGRKKPQQLEKKGRRQGDKTNNGVKTEELERNQKLEERNEGSEEEGEEERTRMQEEEEEELDRQEDREENTAKQRHNNLEEEEEEEEEGKKREMEEEECRKEDKRKKKKKNRNQKQDKLVEQVENEEKMPFEDREKRRKEEEEEESGMKENERNWEREKRITQEEKAKRTGEAGKTTKEKQEGGRGMKEEKQQEQKNKEQKNRGQEEEEEETFKLRVEETNKLTLNHEPQKDGDDKVKRKENRNENPGLTKNSVSNRTPERDRDIPGTQAPDSVDGKQSLGTTNKAHKRIVFSWSQKRRQRSKPTKFCKLGTLSTVLPDPCGSLGHSAFTMECRIQCSEERQARTKGTKGKWPGGGSSLATSEKLSGMGKERETSLTEGTGSSAMEGSASGKTKAPTAEERSCISEEDSVRSERPMQGRCGMRRRRRRRGSESPSGESNTLTSSPGGLSRETAAPQQSSICQKNATLNSSTKTLSKNSKRKASYRRSSRLHKTRVSKVSLFGSDSSGTSSSSSSSEVEEEEKSPKKSRTDEEQQQAGLSTGDSRHKSLNFPIPFGTKASEEKEPIERVQISRTRVLSFSSSCSLSASQTTDDSEEKVLTRTTSPGQNRSSQEDQSDTTSDSDSPQQPVTRKCKSLVIESDREDFQGSGADSSVYQRKMMRRRRRRRKVSSESDTGDDGDCASLVKMRHLAQPHVTPQPHSTCRTTETVIQENELPDSGLLCSSPPCVPLQTLPRKPSRGSPGQLEEHSSLAGETGHQALPRKYLNHHLTTSKQESCKETLVPYVAHELHSASKLPVASQRARRTNCGQQVPIGKARTLEQGGIAEEIGRTSSPSKDRKRTTQLLENSPRSSKRQRGTTDTPLSHASRQQKGYRTDDSGNMRETTVEAERLDGQKDAPALPQVKSDPCTLLKKEDNAEPQSESNAQVFESKNQDQTGAVLQSSGESGSEGKLVVEESSDNSTNTSPCNLSSPQKQAGAGKAQGGQILRASHLGPVVFIDRPRFTPKSPQVPKLTTQTPVPAGPEYIDRLFSELNRRIGVSTLPPAHDNHAEEPQGSFDSQTERANNSSHQPSLTWPSRGIDYQGERPVLLPNIYGTLRPVPAAIVPPVLPEPSAGSSHPHSEPRCTHSSTSHPIQPMSASTGKQAQDCQNSPTLAEPHTTPGYPHLTSVHSQPTRHHPTSTPGHPHLTNGQSLPVYTPRIPPPPPDYNPQYTHSASLPGLRQMSWLPEIIPEISKRQAKRQQKMDIATAEDLEEMLEEVVASRIQSRWWVSGLKRICTSLSTAALPSFLRVVLKSILRSDPLEPLLHNCSLPPRLYRLFQVVSVVEERLAPQHSNSLHNALLRAIQGIVTRRDVRLRPHSLACLTAWYVAAASVIDGKQQQQAEAGQQQQQQEWGRARAFLVDLLFHHPGAAHLALLTAANTCRGLLLKLVQHRVASGLELVLVWLAHYGAWVGLSTVRSDLTKWLAHNLDLKKPPNSPATLVKKLVALLAPGGNKDQQWEAVAGLVVLARWHGRLWIQKYLLPALSAATPKSATVSQEEAASSCWSREAAVLQEDLKTKTSCLFGNLGRALSQEAVQSEGGDVVKVMEDSVTSLLSLSCPSTSDLRTSGDLPITTTTAVLPPHP